MRLHNLLLSSCAVICLALPGTGLAQPGGDHPDGRGRGHQRETTGDNHRGRRTADHTTPPTPVVQTPASPVVGEPGATVRRGGGDSGASPVIRRGRRTGVETPGHIDVPIHARPTITRRRPAPPNPIVGFREPVQTGGVRPSLGGWNRSVHGPARAQMGERWRAQHRNWDQSAPWRSNRTWWRGRPSFRLFTGPRVGFYFFPDYGYIIAPQSYQNRQWRAGEYLPSWFWRYRVRDYEDYGLPTPPYGCAWIWLNGDVALVDLSDGYILDIVYDVW